jgi:membrane protein
MKMKEKIKGIINILKETFAEFMSDRGIKLSASLSYYTIFSLPPLLIIIIVLCGIFFGTDAVKGEIFGQIHDLVGNEAALQIQEMIKNVKISGDNFFAAIVGVITLILGASGVFMEIQDSINSIWGLKAKPRKGFRKLVINRLLSFSMVVSMGFLLLVALIVNALMDILNNRLIRIFPDVTVYFFYILNLAFVCAIITLLFSIIFKTLPDGKVNWKDTLIGSLFTAFLFMIGKFAIGAYLGNSNIAGTYGSAGSLIIILLWVYYTAIILYFGASFTKVYAYKFGKKIIPNKYAVFIQKKEVEHEPEVVNADN